MYIRVRYDIIYPRPFIMIESIQHRYGFEDKSNTWEEDRQYQSLRHNRRRKLLQGITADSTSQIAAMK